MKTAQFSFPEFPSLGFCTALHFFVRTGMFLAVCLILTLLSQQFCWAQPGGGRGGRDGGGMQGRGGFPGAMGGPGGMQGRGGFPGAMGGPGGMQGRGGFPGAMGGPGGMQGRGGFPGAMGGPGGMQGRGGAPGGFPGAMMGGPGGGMTFSVMPATRRPSENAASTTASMLVPEFGETITETQTVPKFGEYVEARTVATNMAIRGSSQQDELQRQINEQAQQMMTRYDKDKNGMIEKSTDEWRNIRIDTDAADVNRDGRITLDELRVYVGNQLRGGTSGAKIFTSYSTTYEHMPEGIPSWFTERDKDNDGQLTLFEYANGQPLTQSIVEEFEWLDLNNDGIATLNECYSAIKTKEELERKQREEQGEPAAGNARDRRNQGNRGGNNDGGFTPSADRERDQNNNNNARGGPARGQRPGGEAGGRPGGGRGGDQQRGTRR